MADPAPRRPPNAIEPPTPTAAPAAIPAAPTSANIPRREIPRGVSPGVTPSAVSEPDPGWIPSVPSAARIAWASPLSWPPSAPCTAAASVCSPSGVSGLWDTWVRLSCGSILSG